MLDPYHVAVAIILDNDARELAIDLAVVGPCLLSALDGVPRLGLLPRRRVSGRAVAVERRMLPLGLARQAPTYPLGELVELKP